MSFVLKLIIVGWLTTFAMIGFFAFRDSGKLLRLRKRIATWLYAPAASVGASEGAEREEAA